MPPTHQTSPAPTLTTKDSSTLKQWTLKAKVGLRSQNGSGSANITWQQQKQHYLIRLSGPLGQGATTIEGNDNGVELRRHTGDHYYAATPEALVQQYTQWPLPVSKLFDWIRGLPSTGERGEVKVNAEGHLRQLQQAGWTVSFSRYQQVQAYWLPHKLVLRQGDDRFTIVIKEWDLEQS